MTSMQSTFDCIPAIAAKFFVFLSNRWIALNQSSSDQCVHHNEICTISHTVPMFQMSRMKGGHLLARKNHKEEERVNMTEGVKVCHFPFFDLVKIPWSWMMYFCKTPSRPGSSRASACQVLTVRIQWSLSLLTVNINTEPTGQSHIAPMPAFFFFFFFYPEYKS